MSALQQDLQLSGQSGQHILGLSLYHRELCVLLPAASLVTSKL